MKVKPKASTPGAPRKARALTHEEYMALLYGDNPNRPAFASREAMREAWIENRIELARATNPGTRPSGWWLFEHPGGRDLVNPDALLELIRCGELTEWEAGRFCGRSKWSKECEAAWQERQAGEADNA